MKNTIGVWGSSICAAVWCSSDKPYGIVIGGVWAVLALAFAWADRRNHHG